jgi:hypothetical protein
MSRITNSVLLNTCLLLSLAVAQAQNPIISQVVDGGGWQTTIVMGNSTSSPVTVTLSFYSDAGSGGDTGNWQLQFVEGSSSSTFTIPAAGTLLLHSFGTAPITTSGWAQVQAPAGINAFAITSETVHGSPNQLTTSPGVTPSRGVLVPFDNTRGNVTSLALVNPSQVSETLSVGLQLNSGASSQQTPIVLPSQGHLAFSTAQQFPATSGQSGQLEFYVPGGSITGLALLFDPTGAFSGVPLTPEAGSPLIVGGPGGGGGGGGGSPSPFSSVTITTANNAPVVVSVSILCMPNCVAVVNAAVPLVLTAAGDFNNVTFSGNTVNFAGWDIQSSTMADTSGDLAQITTASLSVNLNPQGAATSGTVAGSINLVSTLGTISGSFSGTYTAIPAAAVTNQSR